MQTPPNEPNDGTAGFMDTAANVLRAQAATLMTIASSYSLPGSANQTSFEKSINIIHDSVRQGGKVVFTAMGKSLKIGEKLAATLNSLGVTSLTLHPTDALHGDLGCLNTRDIVIMITASGNTPELLALLPHLPQDLRWLCLTCTANSPLGRASSGVLHAEVPQEHNELNVYGLAAPTMSTTACLAVGDALCITLNEMLIKDAKQRKNRFGKWHPGGAIGKMNRLTNTLTSWNELAHVDKDILQCDELDLWRVTSYSDYVVNDFDIYSSRDIIEWLRGGRCSLPRGVSLDHLAHLTHTEAVNYMGELCVVVDNGERVGLMIKSDSQE